MSRIGHRFTELLKSRSKALIPFVTAGDPDIKTTKKLAAAMERRGADIIELGVPFSDPLADGTTIQRASQRALRRGVDLAAVLQAASEIRKGSSIPLVLMSYFNPILHHGLARFVDDATGAGVDGLIVPDLPPDEAVEFLKIAKPQGFDLIFLVAPTSTAKRIRLVNLHSSGFIYCVSLTGVTGVRKQMGKGLSDFLRRVRNCADKPLAVGFGISTPVQARKAARLSDGVIIGSAIVDIIEKTENTEVMVKKVGAFISELKDGIQ